MRRLHRRGGLLVTLAIIIASNGINGLALASSGNPGGGGKGGGTPTSISAAWVYSNANADGIKSDISNGNYSDGQYLSNYSSIFLKNPALPGSLQPAVTMGYDTALSGADNFLDYTYSYDCTSSGIASTDLSPTAPHWTVHYTIALDPGTNFVNDNQLKGYARYSEIIASPSGQTQNAGLAAVTGIGAGTLGAPAKCFPFQIGTVLTYNFAKLSPAEQKTYPNQASTVFNSPKLAAAGTTSDDSCESSDTAGNFGWALCPAIDLANNTIRALVNNIIIPELTITPLQTSGDEYNVWQDIRALANVLFVLIFMVIIFANALQFNLDAYTIKKVLPKLVAATILVQFSYIISSLIVDIGNILGQGIQALIHVAVNYTPTTPDTPLNKGADPLIYGLGAAFDTAALIAIIATIGVPTIAIAVLGGLISVVGVVFTLVARQLIIIMLVVLSPLAFAAFVLPNTDRYFSVWLKMFIRISLMFPLIILLLDVAAIGQNASAGSSLAHLLAIIFPVIAFFLIPMTFKWAGSAMAFAANGINKASTRASKGATSGLKGSDAYKGWQDRRNERKAQKINEAATSANPVRAYLGGVRQRGDFLAGRKLTMQGLQKDPIKAAQARTKEREGWENAKKIMEALPNAELEMAAKGQGHGTSSANATAAQAILASRGRLPDDTLRQIVQASGGTTEQKQRRLDYVRQAGKDIFKASPVRALAPVESMSFTTNAQGKPVLDKVDLHAGSADAMKTILAGKSTASLLEMSPQGIEDLSKTQINGVAAVQHIDHKAIAGIAADKRQLSKMSREMHDKMDAAITAHGTAQQQAAWGTVKAAYARL